MSIYSIHSKEQILKEISKLRPIKHNPYFWWRKFESKTIPIHKRSPIEDKIKAGYYNFSTYFWQAQYALLESNELYDKSSSYEVWVEKSSTTKNRYKRLMEDFHKDENERIERIIEDFTNEYILKREQVKDILENFGFDIKELYIMFEEKYKYPIRPSWKKTF